MKSHKNILIYYSSMRSFLIYREILEKYPKLFEIIIEMPALPHSRTSNKRNYMKFIKSSITSPGYFFIQLFTIYFYKFFGEITKNTIKHKCNEFGIKHYFFNRVDKDFIELIKSKNPNYLISSASSLLPEDLLSLPKLGTINLHEAPLPKYRGSAAYFWFLFNEESTAWVTCHYVEKELDAGDIIFEGKKIQISKKLSIFNIWKKMLISYDFIWEKLIPYLIKPDKLPSKVQNKKEVQIYSYPSRELSLFLRKNRINIFTYSDIVFIIKTLFFKI